MKGKLQEKIDATEYMWFGGVIGDFVAYLTLRSNFLFSHDVTKRFKTRKEALIGLKRKIKNEIKWLEEQSLLIDKILK